MNASAVRCMFKLEVFQPSDWRQRKDAAAQVPQPVIPRFKDGRAWELVIYFFYTVLFVHLLAKGTSVVP